MFSSCKTYFLLLKSISKTDFDMFDPSDGLGSFSLESCDTDVRRQRYKEAAAACVDV